MSYSIVSNGTSLTINIGANNSATESVVFENPIPVGHKIVNILDFHSGYAENNIYLGCYHRVDGENNAWIGGSYENPKNQTLSSKIVRIFTTNKTMTGFMPFIYGSPNITEAIELDVNIIDLTAMGLDNINTVEEFEAMFPNNHYPYSAGTIIHGSVDKVISSTGDDFTIPPAILSLDGYGWGIDDTVRNYVDWEQKKFVKMVDKFVLQGTESFSIPGTKILDFSVFRCDTFAISKIPYLCNEFEYKTDTYGNQSTRCVCAYTTGTQLFFIVPDTEIEHENITAFKAWLKSRYIAGNPVVVYYKLKTPVETDISGIISDDNFIPVEDGGTLTFHHTEADNGNLIPVPTKTTYCVKLGGNF